MASSRLFWTIPQSDNPRVAQMRGSPTLPPDTKIQNARLSKRQFAANITAKSMRCEELVKMLFREKAFLRKTWHLGGGLQWAARNFSKFYFV